MTEPLVVLRTVAELRTHIHKWRKEGLAVGLVPTMGALHDGHLALVKAAKAECDRVIVSLFVNPLQFAPGEDFEAYPRDEEADRQCLAAAGSHVLYAPSPGEMFPRGDLTQISVDHFNTLLEGLSRPGHFKGVATVVTKLLNQAQADNAFFGEKDYQQLLLITHLAKDLFIPTKIHGVPTVREADGLAMSSRNAYLSAKERVVAGKLHNILKFLREAFLAGDPAERLDLDGREALTNAGFNTVDYLAVADAETLQLLNSYDPLRPARILVAVKLGDTRLIDNIAI